MDVKSLKYFDIFSNSVDSNQEEKNLWLTEEAVYALKSIYLNIN